MPIGDPITESIPAVGSSGPDYATDLVAFLEEVKTRLEAEVPVSSLLAGTFDQSNNPITNLQYVGLYEQATQPAGPAGSLQRYNGNLWYVSSSGAFQLTDGAGINASSIGGFTGDYGSPNPAEARFVDADQRYNFYDHYGLAQWAYVRARGFDVAGGASSSNRVRIQYAGVTDWTISLPSAVPVSQGIMQMDAGGDILVSNELAEDADLVLYGQGIVKTGDRTLFVNTGSSDGWVAAGGTPLTKPVNSPGATVDSTTAVTSARWPFFVPEGYRVKSIQFVLSAVPAVSVAYAYGFWTASNSTVSQHATTSSTTQETTLNGTGTPTTYSVPAGSAGRHYIEVTPSSGGSVTVTAAFVIIEAIP